VGAIFAGVLGFSKGIYRDPTRSSHSHFVKASGLRWVSLVLLAPVPWAARTWAVCTIATNGVRPERKAMSGSTSFERILMGSVRLFIPVSTSLAC
jgi:hypothetical protein